MTSCRFRGFNNAEYLHGAHQLNLSSLFKLKNIRDVAFASEVLRAYLKLLGSQHAQSNAEPQPATRTGMVEQPDAGNRTSAWHSYCACWKCPFVNLGIRLSHSAGPHNRQQHDLQPHEMSWRDMEGGRGGDHSHFHAVQDGQCVAGENDRDNSRCFQPEKHLSHDER